MFRTDTIVWLQSWVTPALTAVMNVIANAIQMAVVLVVPVLAAERLSRNHTHSVRAA